MPKVSRDKLSDPTIKAAKFEGRAHKLHYGDGLFLHIKQGCKYWHFRFWLGVGAKGKAKERLMSLGVYPKVSLSGARKERDKARVLLARALTPSPIGGSRRHVRRSQEPIRSSPSLVSGGRTDIGTTLLRPMPNGTCVG
jgi:hypothetical protein